MHKYFEKKPPKIKQKTETQINSDGEEVDPEMEAFAERAIEEKMDELNRGTGFDSEDDYDFGASEGGEDDLDEDDELIGGDDDQDQDDFFANEDLDEVDLGSQ